MLSAEFVGFIAGALGMFFGLPQALRVRRLGHGRGVSLVSWLLQFGVAISWAAYGLDINSPSVLITNLGASLINASVITAIMRNKLKSTTTLIVSAGVLSSLVLLLPSFWVSTLLISLVFAQSPQIVKSYKNISGGKDSAVSIIALSVSSFSIFLWFIYAIMVGDSLIILSAVISFSSMMTIIILELIGKSKRALNTA